MAIDTTSVKLPPKLKTRVAALARKSGRSAHSFIVEAVERHAEREERLQNFVKEALAADADIERTGEVYRAEDVHAWLDRLAKRAEDLTAQAVATVAYSARALDHLERAFEFLAQTDPTAALNAAAAIQSAVSTLAAHPLIGRRIEGEIRELVISFGKSGYVALYRFIPYLDAVRVLAIRHQRELDYPE